MPDGTEMPAPVSTTARSESRSRPATCSTRVVAARSPPLGAFTCPRTAARSLALEPRPTLRQERGDPLARVIGAERACETLALYAKSLVERRLRGALLDLLHRNRRLLGQLPRPCQSRVEQLVIRHDLVREAHAVRLVGIDRVAGEVHLERLRLTHQPRQPLGAAEPGDEPKVDLRLAKGGRLRSDAEVA